MRGASQVNESDGDVSSSSWETIKERLPIGGPGRCRGRGQALDVTVAHTRSPPLSLWSDAGEGDTGRSPESGQAGGWGPGRQAFPLPHSCCSRRGQTLDPVPAHFPCLSNVQERGGLQTFNDTFKFIMSRTF